MAEPILFDVRIETAKATGDYRKFTEEVKRGSADAAKSITTTASAAESSAKRTTVATGALAGSAQTMGQKFAGAGSSISGANAALQLMGRQGPPALQTIGSAAASVAVSGFGPLAIAITAATVAVSLFTASGEDSISVLERQGIALSDLARSSVDARTKLEALQTNKSVQDIELERAIEVAESRVRNSEERKRKLERSLAFDDFAAPGVAQAINFVSGANLLTEGQTRDKLNAERQALGVLNEELARLKDVAETLAEIKRLEDLRADKKRKELEIEAALRARDAEIAAGDRRSGAERSAAARRAESAGFRLRSIQTGENVNDLEMQAEIDRRRRLTPDSDQQRRDNEATIKSLEEELALSIKIREEQERIAAAAESDRFFRSFGEKGAASITGALSQTLQTGDLDGFFDSFQAAMTSTVADAFAAALIQKPLENLLGNFTSSIGANAGGFFGLLSDPTSPGVGATPKGPPVPPITVIDVNGGADALVSGLSKQGKQAIVQEGLMV